MTTFGAPLDQLAPELVHLQHNLAGPVGRGIAATVDAALAGAVAVVLHAALEALPGREPAWGATFLASLLAVATAGEIVGRGRTPGKALVGLRVVRLDGRGARPAELFLRNALRIVDVFPLPYGLGLASVVLSRRSQRLGDMVAGTVVVVDPLGRRRLRTRRVFVAPGPPDASSVAAEAAAPRTLPAWDVRGLSERELAALRRFLVRRWDLTSRARAAHAQSLRDHVLPLVPGADPRLPAEELVEVVVAIADRTTPTDRRSSRPRGTG